MHHLLEGSRRSDDATTAVMLQAVSESLHHLTSEMSDCNIFAPNLRESPRDDAILTDHPSRDVGRDWSAVVISPTLSPLTAADHISSSRCLLDVLRLVAAMAYSRFYL